MMKAIFLRKKALAFPAVEAEEETPVLRGGNRDMLQPSEKPR